VEAVKKTTSQNVWPELIRINELIKTAQNAVLKNPRCFFFGGVSREILRM